MMTTPLFLPLELISIKTQNYAQLISDLSLWMSQDTSHSPSPIPPLEHPTPPPTLILLHLPSQLMVPQIFFTKYS